MKKFDASTRCLDCGASLEGRSVGTVRCFGCQKKRERQQRIEVDRKKKRAERWK